MVSGYGHTIVTLAPILWRSMGLYDSNILLCCGVVKCSGVELRLYSIVSMT